jgi:predicted transcriptional regulator
MTINIHELNESEYAVFQPLLASPHSLSVQEIHRQLAFFSFGKIKRILESLELNGYVERRKITREERRKEKYLWFITPEVRDKVKEG